MVKCALAITFYNFFIFFLKDFIFKSKKNPHSPSTPKTKYFYEYKSILTLVINKFPIKATRKKTLKFMKNSEKLFNT